MLFRFRTYRLDSGMIERFDSFFLGWLLPVQRRHGARLIGRWRSEPDREVRAVWAYRDEVDYERVSTAVRNDPQTAEAQRVRAELGIDYDHVEEAFGVSTVPLPETEHAHLEEVDA